MAGLRDALFDEMEDLRSGASASHEAVAFSNLASRVLESVEMEVKREALILERRRQRLQVIAMRRAEQLLPPPDESQNAPTIENVL